MTVLYIFLGLFVFVNLLIGVTLVVSRKRRNAREQKPSKDIYPMW